MPSPTGIPSDVPLVSYGVEQAGELARYLVPDDDDYDDDIKNDNGTMGDGKGKSKIDNMRDGGMTSGDERVGAGSINTNVNVDASANVDVVKSGENERNDKVEKIDRIYSSPFVRCLQTLEPVIKRLEERERRKKDGYGHVVEVRGENGFGYVMFSRSSLLCDLYSFGEGGHGSVSFPEGVSEWKLLARF